MTEHARRRMIERGIPIEWVERTLENPAFVRESPSRTGRKSAFRRIEELEGRWLHVIFEGTGSETVVISVYVDHKAEKRR